MNRLTRITRALRIAVAEGYRYGIERFYREYFDPHQGKPGDQATPGKISGPNCDNPPPAGEIHPVYGVNSTISPLSPEYLEKSPGNPPDRQGLAPGPEPGDEFEAAAELFLQGHTAETATIGKPDMRTGYDAFEQIAEILDESECCFVLTVGMPKQPSTVSWSNARDWGRRGVGEMRLAVMDALDKQEQQSDF